MKTSDDYFDDPWEALRPVASENLLLRSFLEYLRMWPDSPERKEKRLQNWRTEVGLQMGNPAINEHAEALFRKVQAAPPEMRKTILQQGLAAMSTVYFEGS